MFWGSFVERDLQSHRANMAQIFGWTADKKLTAHVHRIFPLAETAAALDELLARRAKGKVLVRCSSLSSSAFRREILH